MTKSQKPGSTDAGSLGGNSPIGKYLIVGFLVLFAALVVGFNLYAKFARDAAKAEEDAAAKLQEETQSDLPERDTPEFVNGLQQTLMVMKQQMMSEPRERQKDLQSKRIELAEELLELAQDDDQRGFAVKTMFDALQRLYSLGETDSIAKMETLVAENRASQIGDVAISGELALISIYYGEAMNNEGELAPLLSQVDQFLADHQDNPDVAIFLRQMLERTIEEGHRDQGLQLARIMLKHYQKSNAQAAVSATIFLEGMLLMEGNNFNQLTLNLLQNQEGAVQQYVDVLKPLVEQRKVNLFVYDSIFRTLGLVAKEKHFVAAKQFAEQLKPIFKDYEVADIGEISARDLDFALRRLNMLGRKLNIRGRTALGEEFDPATLEDRVVIVYFFTVEAPMSMDPRIFQSLTQMREDLYDQGVEFVGYVVGQSPIQTIEQMGGTFPSFPIVVPEQSDAEQVGLADKLGIQSAPYIVLLNKQHVVQDIEVHPQMLAQEINFVLEHGEIDHGLNRSDENPPADTPIDGQQSDGGQQTNGDQQSSMDNTERNKFDALDEFDPANWVPRDTNRQGTGRLAGAGRLAVAATVSLFGMLHGEFLAADPGRWAQDEPNIQESKTQESKTQEDEAENPYLAPAHWSTADLLEFLLESKYKPNSIRRRPQFALAVADAAQRVLADTNLKLAQRRLAYLTRTEVLHEQACLGDDTMDDLLAEIIAAKPDAEDKLVLREWSLLSAERQLMDALQLDANNQLDSADLRTLLGSTAEYFAGTELTARHLRMATLTVTLINRLRSDDAQKQVELAKERDQWFKQVGELFAASKAKRLAKYGNYLAKSESTSALVGETMELTGVDFDDVEFDWNSYRGKVVLVDFWATWCGPCRKEMPQVKAILEQLNAKGLEVVGVSLDEDIQAVAEYAKENNIPWTNLCGDQAKQSAQRYGVRAIPTMMVVGPDGKILAVANKVSELRTAIEEALSE